MMIDVLVRGALEFRRRAYRVSALDLSATFQDRLIARIAKGLDIAPDVSFKERELVQRSFAQYRCQSFLWSEEYRLLANILSVLAAVPLAMVFLFEFYKGYLVGCRRRTMPTNGCKREVTVVLFDDMSLLPPSVKESYCLVKYRKRWMLSLRDFGTIFRLLVRHYYYEPYFVVHIMVKMALYKANLVTYKPSSVLSTSEFSFSSSFLTLYCGLNGCQHVNVMHGDKLFYLRDAFCSYDRMYVWEQYYKMLFGRLRCMIKEFIVEKPSWLTRTSEECKKDARSVEGRRKPLLVYYQGSESVGDFYELQRRLKGLEKKFDIVVRLHPRYGMKTIAGLLSNFQIEYPHVTPLEYSLCRAEYVAGLYTTVLQQALWLGKKVLVNDLDMDKYNRLRELGYYLLVAPMENVFRISDLV